MKDSQLEDRINAFVFKYIKESNERFSTLPLLGIDNT